MGEPGRVRVEEGNGIYGIYGSGGVREAMPVCFHPAAFMWDHFVSDFTAFRVRHRVSYSQY